MTSPEQPLMHPAHTRCWELLPWYLNDSLAADEHDLVRQHLGECLLCNRELARLQVLAEAVAAPLEEQASAQAFARLSQQIRSAAAPRWPRRFLDVARGLFEPVPLIAGAGVLVLSSLLVAMIVVTGHVDNARVEQPFQTLGTQHNRSTELSHPLVRVVLREAEGDSGLESWLARHDAELLEGPSDIGVLTVRVAMGTRTFDTVISAIRADDETLFVEPVNRIGTRPDRHR